MWGDGTAVVCLPTWPEGHAQGSTGLIWLAFVARKSWVSNGRSAKVQITYSTWGSGRPKHAFLHGRFQLTTSNCTLFALRVAYHANEGCDAGIKPLADDNLEGPGHHWVWFLPMSMAGQGVLPSVESGMTQMHCLRAMGFCWAELFLHLSGFGLDTAWHLGWVLLAANDPWQGVIPLVASSTNMWVNPPLFPCQRLGCIQRWTGPTMVHLHVQYRLAYYYVIVERYWEILRGGCSEASFQCFTSTTGCLFLLFGWLCLVCFACFLTSSFLRIYLLSNS